MNSTEQTESSIELSINVSDNSSGLSKIIWYYKPSTENEYKSETTTYRKTGTGPTRAMTKTKTISKLLAGKSYDIKVEVYDMAGNMTTSDIITVETLKPKNVTLVTSSDKEPVEVPVPNGYVASSVESEGTVNGGFVIYEGEDEVTEENIAEAKKTRNQFVWIPVEDASEMYWTDADGEIYGTYYDFTSTGYTRRTRTWEPSLVSDDKQEYLGTSREEFLNEMKQNFKEMIDSVTKYGGFYIGRYETGNLSQDVPVVVQMNTDIASQTWYTIYKKTKKISGTNDNVTTGMIWGVQFDKALKWLIDTGNKTYEEIATDSKSWGNYYNVTLTYTNASGGTSTKPNGSQIRIPTGSTECTIANNVYDLAGNVWEWTMDGNGANRYSCGGGYNSYSMNDPTSNSYYNVPYYSNINIRF